MSHLNTTLRQELLEMQAHDQEMRKALFEKYKPGVPFEPHDQDWAESLDQTNRARMKEIIAQYGWPGKSLVGDDGAKAAWLLIQHADRDLAFQKSCLELLEAAATAGEASLTDWAYLTDRVHIHEGKPQVYGTQLQLTHGGFTVGAIEDEAQVDERRAKIGLGPLADYIAATKQLYQKK
jgi:hypothetical protein